MRIRQHHCEVTQSKYFGTALESESSHNGSHPSYSTVLKPVHLPSKFLCQNYNNNVKLFLANVKLYNFHKQVMILFTNFQVLKILTHNTQVLSF